ncbi:hypothetical protein SRHO_G00140150 [Serrasalmus rhombeus]
MRNSFTPDQRSANTTTPAEEKERQQTGFLPRASRGVQPSAQERLDTQSHDDETLQYMDVRQDHSSEPQLSTGKLVFNKVVCTATRRPHRAEGGSHSGEFEGSIVAFSRTKVRKSRRKQQKSTCIGTARVHRLGGPCGRLRFSPPLPLMVQPKALHCCTVYASRQALFKSKQAKPYLQPLTANG